MPREKHEQQINDLLKRHQAVLKQFSKLDRADLILWRHKWLTSEPQFELVASLVEQLEASFKVADIAAQNVNRGLKIVIDANLPTR